MNSPFGYEALVATGVSLIVIGVALRGAARATKRRLAGERQHQRLSGGRTEAPRPLNHWERHGNRYASAAVVLGTLLTLAGFLRR
ncbi:MAG: hypothetical protein C0502_01040 [Opitutus sp.]|nr:hypothetical protein [Opitutus sp.]